MNKPEAIAGAVVVVIGASLLVAASRLAYLVEGVPGPGFLPLWLSFGVIATGIILTVKALRGRLVAEAIEWPDAAGWRQVGMMLGTLALALLVLEHLGFVLTAMAFMAVIVFSLGVRSWRMLLGVPVLSAAGLYLVFATWLRVPLPQGILTFLD